MRRKAGFVDRLWGKMKFLVCDGDTTFLKQLGEKLKETVEKFDKIEINAVCSSEEFLEVIQKNEYKPNVIMMNVQINEESGIDLIKHARDYVKNIQVIFISDSLRYIQDIYEVEHSYFIVKNQLDMRLPYALDKVRKILDEKSSMIVLSKKNSSVYFPEKEVMFCTRRNRTTEIYLESGEKVVVDLKLDELEEKFKGTFLIRCHKSFIVSMRYVASYTRAELILTNSVRIPISRPYIYECKEQFKNWR